MWLQGSYTSNWSGCLCCPPLKGWTRYSRQRELKSSTPFTFLNSLCEMLSCLVGTLTLLEPIFAFFLPDAVGHQSRSQSSQWRPLVCGAHCLPGFGQKPSGESTRPNVALMNSSSVNLLKQKLNPKCMELKDEDDYVDIAALFIDPSVLKLNEPVFAVFAELLVLHWDFVFSAVSEISFMFNFCLYHFGLLLFCFLNFFLVLLSVVISVVITLSFSYFLQAHK